jgi:hypothetical protein
MTIDLWTVTQPTAVMDSLWTAQHDWTTSRPQPAHTRLGQVIDWTPDLPTAAWITTRLDVAVTHTAHRSYDNDFFLPGKEEKKGDTKAGLTLAVNPGKNQIRASLRSE